MLASVSCCLSENHVLYLTGAGIHISVTEQLFHLFSVFKLS